MRNLELILWLSVIQALDAATSYTGGGWTASTGIVTAVRHHFVQIVYAQAVVVILRGKGVWYL